MPDISAKAIKVPSSAIRRLSPYSDRAERDGIKVYHLNIGSPDIDSPLTVRQAVRDYDFKHLEYSNSAGIYELREAMLEKYYKRLGMDLTIDDILITTAGSEALAFTVETVCNPGDEIIVIEPFYTNYYSIACQYGVDVVAVPTVIENDFRLPGIEAFEAVVTPKTKAMLICNPANPAGTLYSKEEVLQMGDFCKRHDLFLISDEVYREFCYTEDPYYSVMNIPGLEENTILVDSVSKRYNLCGARIGAIATKNKAVIAAITKFAQARLCPPVLGQIATIGALEAPVSYFESVRKEYIKRRDFAISALNSIPGVYSPMTYGAFYTIASLPVEDAEDFAKWMLTDFRIDGETVMITPAASFYRTPGVGANQVRIAYVLEVPELKKAFHILEEGLKAYNSR